MDVSITQDGDDLLLRVADNGVGLDGRAEAKRGTFGLFGIYERAAFLGGAMKISSRLTGGTELVVRIPKSAPVAGGDQ